ncbi:hypothetical protein [Actinoplanes solisilvae]|nr:hypothetical protein [Actinoplanes solisilvae]
MTAEPRTSQGWLSSSPPSAIALVVMISCFFGFFGSIPAKLRAERV